MYAYSTCKLPVGYGIKVLILFYRIQQDRSVSTPSGLYITETVMVPY